jgi:hypothetical protein
MNTLAYIIYLFITYLITVHVGLRFYRNGRVYILRLLHGDEKMTDSINNILLVGYYLLNLGYASLMISTWKTIGAWAELVGSISTMTGKIMLALAIMHFFNMTVIYFISRKHNTITHHKI